jgi:hypothetical protein
MKSVSQSVRLVRWCRYVATIVHVTYCTPRRPGFKPGSGHVGFCDGQKWRWGRFPPRTSFSPANLRSICFSTINFTITRGWHNRPGVAAVPIASQTRIKKKKKTYCTVIVGDEVPRCRRCMCRNPTFIDAFAGKSYKNLHLRFSVCLSPFVWPPHEPLDGFPWNLVLESFVKIYHHAPTLISYSER